MNKKYITISITLIMSIFIGSTVLTAKPATVSTFEEAVSPAISEKTTTENSTIADDKTNQNQHTVAQTSSQPSAQPAAAKSSQQVQQKTVRSTPSRSTSSNTSATSRQAKANAIISTAKQYIGVKYLWGGTTPAGFDCSGYTRYVFAQHGIDLPRISRDQYNVGTPVAFDNLQSGDLVFFSLDNDGVIDHEGIYIGNGQFINSSSSKGVTIYTLGDYWKSRYIGAKRVF